MSITIKHVGEHTVDYFDGEKWSCPESKPFTADSRETSRSVTHVDVDRSIASRRAHTLVVLAQFDVEQPVQDAIQTT